MKKAQLARLDDVHDRLDALPIPAELMESAFEKFPTTGELPEDTRLARAIVRRCKYGDSGWPGQGASSAAALQAALAFVSKPTDRVLHALYDEAVFADGMVRDAARDVLRLLAECGSDPTGPVFVGSDVAVPDFGGVGLHLLGWPELLARSPYEAQAARLFAPAATLRARIPHGPRWRARLDAATTAFQHHGERPDDPLLLDAVLVLGEAYALMQHLRGVDVAQHLALFDTAASDSPAREPAIAELQALAKVGAFTPTDPDPPHPTEPR